MAKILVTGGAGFIGSDLSNKLIDLRHKVFVVDNLATGNKNYLKKGISFFKEDISSTNLDPLMNKIKPDYIYHFAAQSSLSRSLKYPQEDIDINILATQRLINAANKIKVRKIIFSSSAAVHGSTNRLPIKEEDEKNPISIYGVSKLSSEHLFRLNYFKNNTSFISFRYANVYGEKQNQSSEGGVVAILINKILHGNIITIFGDGNQTRDFIYVSDVNRANIFGLNENIRGIFNIGTGIQTSINNLHQLMTQITLSKSKIIYKDLQHLEVNKNSLSYKKFNKLTSWKPKINLNAGLTNTFNYFKSKIR